MARCPWAGSPCPQCLPQAGCRGDIPHVRQGDKGPAEAVWLGWGQTPLQGSRAGGFVKDGGNTRLCWWVAARADGGTATTFNIPLLTRLEAGLEAAGAVLWLTPPREAAREEQCHSRCHTGKVICSRMAAAWPGECCDSWGHFGPLAPCELHLWSHWWDSGWILCRGMLLVAWQWVTAWGAAPSRVRGCHSFVRGGRRQPQAGVHYWRCRRRRFPGQG